MEFQLDREWRLQPIKGATGQTYMGKRKTERVFIKRNTSPLLAALSKEGIAPKLVWTKRTANGDVLTAQEWLDGYLLTANEIGSRNDVVDVLYHLHHSNMLKNMLGKIGGQIFTPTDLLEDYEANIPLELRNNSYLTRVLQYLKLNLPDFPLQKYMVVHGDVNHRNWIVSNRYLYLVDWDSVMISDPALDIGMLLGHYVPREAWKKWLLAYGLYPSEEALKRIYWYVLFGFLQEIIRYYQSGERREMNLEILKLKQTFGY
ncbi:phosphotransferase family protein [Enterococcus rivorum]|uniref:Aminoglycoside phosphotransferase n=1 Tax=Enterococcus rivorum TaxID=762845 RepID=A0A1E5KZM0_9ENTE|nr:phosphotransferase family protein [Enterococcus rivorum]MBP2099402.1 thiamine kinase-like enzyme [Enterococcus rivorum]OEH83264.1 aminoglycoside phosphotransferase [Enterococcus rivorum]